MKKNYYVLSLVLASFTIVSCSSDSGDDDVIQTPDPSDSWSEWSAWTPEFTNQTSDFTQSRSRTVVVNGDRDATQPSGNANETRSITVTSNAVTEEDNERTTSFNLDLNGDGDFVDYVERTATTYTASNGLGSHTVYSDWTISFDQDADFFSLQYGKWFTTIVDSDGDFLFDWGLDIFDAYEDVDTVSRFDGQNCLTVENLSETINDTPYSSSLVDLDDPTELTYGLYNIPAEYYLGADYVGNYVDVVGSYVTTDEAGNTIIGFSETMYVAGTLTSLFSVNGTLGRVDAFAYQNCETSSKSKSYKLKRPQPYIEGLKKNLDSYLNKQ